MTTRRTRGAAITAVVLTGLAALTALATAAVPVGNLLADLFYGLFDPRVKFSDM
ncbi:hypothetical protein [Streptomyces sp. NPDC002491]